MPSIATGTGEMNSGPYATMVERQRRYTPVAGRPPLRIPEKEMRAVLPVSTPL